MKKTYLSTLFAVMVSALLLSSCTTISKIATADGANGSQGLVGSLLTTLIGNALPVNEAAVVGTWKYTSPEVRFESESALTQAGGAVAASQIEAKLSETYSKLGITPGSCSFTFGEDKTCTIVMGSQKIGGKFSIDPNTRNFTFKSNTGLISLNGKIYFTGKSLSLLFDAKKLLSIAQTLSAVTGQSNATLGALSQMLGSYDGLMLGMNLSK